MFGSSPEVVKPFREIRGLLLKCMKETKPKRSFAAFTSPGGCRGEPGVELRAIWAIHQMR
jgi:hypothetical protein